MNKILIFLCLPFILSAQIPAGYYNSVQGMTGNALKSGLHNIIKNHTVLAYSALWTAFPSTDKKANGKVWDIYSHKPVGAQPYEYTFGTNQCGSYNSEADCYNREHSWPQSWFNSVTGPDSDLFHVYPTDGYVNGLRGNFPFGEVGSASSTTQNGSKLGNCVSAGYSSTVFEPIDEYKGDLARSYFYMTTRYYTEDAGWSTSPATSKATILQWQLNILLTWHQQDPVSAKEIARNDSIYKLQDNRNPFIDHPNYADSIWLSATAIQEMTEHLPEVNIAPNPASAAFKIYGEMQSAVQLNIYDMQGRVIETKNFKAFEERSIDCNDWPAGLYIVKVSYESYPLRARFLKVAVQ